MKDKNIIGINGSFLRKPATGIGQVSWHFSRELIRREDEQFSGRRYIIYTEERLQGYFWRGTLPKNIEVKIIEGWYKRDDLIRKILLEKFWLPKQVKKDRCNTFFSPYQSATILPRKIKHIMFVHDVIPNIFPEYLNNFRKKIYYWLVTRSIKKASKILTNSKFSQKDIAKVCKLKQSDIKVVYLDCDPIFRKEISKEEREKRIKKYKLNLTDKYIFNFGGIDIRKNVDRVIKAYGKLSTEIKDLPSLVIGGKFYKHLVPLVPDIEQIINDVCQKYNLNKDKFKAIGFVEQEDLPALYQSAEVFIYPSLYEGFGIPVLQGMCSRCPVITSNTTSIPEVISSEAGYLVENPENVDEIKEQLKKALTDSLESREEKISLAYQESQKFSWDKFTEEVLRELN